MSVRERRNRKGLGTPGSWEPVRVRGALDRLRPERTVSIDPETGIAVTLIDWGLLEGWQSREEGH